MSWMTIGLACVGVLILAWDWLPKRNNLDKQVRDYLADTTIPLTDRKLVLSVLTTLVSHQAQAKLKGLLVEELPDE